MYTSFSVQDPARITRAPIPVCRVCKWLKVYTKYGAQRDQCYCDHHDAKAIYKKYGLKSEPTFIGFSEKMCSVPAIKTSPKWCPLRVQNVRYLTAPPKEE